MSRLALTLATLAALLASTGCRSIGRFPTIDPSDYAYTYFNGKLSQIFQFTVPQVESSALQALADLGFDKIEREREDGVVYIHSKTPDHRHCYVTIQPQNAMSDMSIRVGLEGDELVSAALMQRVALNFGTLPRTVIPMEPTLSRRLNVRTIAGQPAGPISASPMLPVDPIGPVDAPSEIPDESPASSPPAPDMPPPPAVPGPFGMPGAPEPVDAPAPDAMPPAESPRVRSISQGASRPS